MTGTLTTGRQGFVARARRAARGIAVRKQTFETIIKGHQVRASTGNPQYIVESDNGGQAAHKPDALTKE